jgi:hypothetical protein
MSSVRNPAHFSPGSRHSGLGRGGRGVLTVIVAKAGRSSRRPRRPAGRRGGYMQKTGMPREDLAEVS